VERRRCRIIRGVRRLVWRIIDSFRGLLVYNIIFIIGVVFVVTVIATPIAFVTSELTDPTPMGTT
jgi:hypothetical protein